MKKEKRSKEVKILQKDDYSNQASEMSKEKSEIMRQWIVRSGMVNRLGVAIRLKKYWDDY